LQSCGGCEDAWAAQGASEGLPVMERGRGVVLVSELDERFDPVGFE
jgi:hypothetical protein